MTSAIRQLACALLFLLSALPALAAPTFPALTGPVVDEAGILDPSARGEFAKDLQDYRTTTGRQINVAIVKSLDGYEVRDYGNLLFRAWKLGEQQRNDGVLLLVAPSERKVAIEVGYGLEGTLTDALSKIIIENAILPQFKQGDMAGGIRAGIADIKRVLGGEADQVALKGEQDTSDVVFNIIFWVVLFFCIALLVMSLLGQMGQASNVRSGRRRSDNWTTGGWGGGGSGGWSGGGSGGGWSGGGGSSGGGGASGSW